MLQFTQRSRFSATLLLAGGLLLGGGMASAAQDGTPSAAIEAHPAHIHTGSCDNADPNPTYMLTDVTPPTGDTGGAIPVERSTTRVDDTLEHLRTGGYSIIVHHSADDIGTYIDCGNLGGELGPDGALVVGLGELNGSGHTGIAILTANGDQTDVNLYLTPADASATDAGAAASATASHQMANADATMLTIKDLAYEPATITIPVGSTITWTNDDSVQHTVTAKNRDVLQSGALAPGATYSQTFSTPGTIEYFCEFHANMKGSIVVE